MDSLASPGPTPTPTAAAAIVIVQPPPPFPAAPRTVDLSALEFILGLIAVISIPSLIYIFFFAIRCPRRSPSPSPSPAPATEDSGPSPPAAVAPSTGDVKYSREIHSRDLGDECTVCLSAFGDGEEIKKLSSCGHAFHVECIDKWLSSNLNCPVCRAPVPAPPGQKQPSGNSNINSNSNSNRNNHRSSRTREDDFHQGLPDASNLV